jgi:hypothetical protein
MVGAVTQRRIDIGGETPVTGADPGPVPVLDWIAIADLFVDEAYQRPLDARSWARIRQIAAAFHWSKFSPMMVGARVARGYPVIDGQHRAHAALLRGIAMVPALILPQTEAVAAQAHAFVAVNGTAQRVSSQGLYRAALATGAPWALLLRDTVEAAGLTVATCTPTASARKPRVIYSVATVRAFTDGGDIVAVTAALSALRTYDTQGRVGLYDGYVLAPWLAFAAKAPATVAQLVAVLGRRDPFKVIATAQLNAGPQNPYRAEAVAIWSAMLRDVRKAVAA